MNSALHQQQTWGEALHLIDTEPFDVLLCDLHMPGAGDGFTVVSAMRHTNPEAVTLVFTGYPALQEAMDAILLQADEILIKPMSIPALLALIREKLQKRGARTTDEPRASRGDARSGQDSGHQRYGKDAVADRPA
jgi:DNA-binding NtrC family response regulator